MRDPSWFAVLESEFSTPTMQQLRAFLVTEARQGQQVYPPGREIFNAFALTPFDQVRVVILGQDPYHGPGQAHGLCFSVRRGVRPPPSLVNIFKELEDDLGVPRPSHGELTTWAQQGVLLLNTVLTVRHRKPKSHAGKGWEQFTDRVIAELNTRREGLVFVLWGSAARQKAQSVNRGKHLVLTSPHPSPYSADRGFFGCKHFSKINTYLTSHGSAPIDWSLPDG
ncbi:MAG: uracil-DNA glycosylase [Myxococcota bacterium]